MSGEVARLPIVYEPTVTGLPPLRPYLAALWERRRFIWHLARTDLKSEHYNTVLGQFWVIIDPLFLAAVYFLLRSVVRPAASGADRNLVIAHLIWAVFFFMYTHNVVTAASRSLVKGGGLILNASFPRAALPLVAVIKAACDFAPTLLVYFGFQVILGQPVTPALLFVPLVVVILTVFNTGVALLVAPLTVFYRDTANIIPYVTRIWMYITPVLFTISEIPPGLKAYLRWNPLYPMFAALEQIFTGSTPSLGALAAATTWAVVALFVGSVVFLSRERELAVRL
ncbi:MAG: ABC transporter permease [Actinomycetota bacterium]